MAESDLQLSCPKCSTIVTATIEQAGETIVCRRCDNKLLVPGQKAKSTDVTVDDLISFDDDVLNPNSQGDEIVASAIDDSEEDTSPARPETTDPVSGELGSADNEIRIAELEVDDSIPTLLPDGYMLPDDGPEGDPSGVDAVEESSDSDDDLGDLIDIPIGPDPVTVAENPFEVDENANLVVEGVTPQDNQFGVDCTLCGSLLYATVSQVGTKIKCHDCHSLIEVHPPREKPKPVEQFAPRPDDDGEIGYQLSDPYELEPIDTTVDKTLEIDYDDDEFFEKRRELQRRQMDAQAEKLKSRLATDSGENDEGDTANEPVVDEIKVEDPFDADAGEYGLAPAEDLPKPDSGLPPFTGPPPGSDDDPPPENHSTEIADEDLPVRVEPEPAYGDETKSTAKPAAEELPNSETTNVPEPRTQAKKKKTASRKAVSQAGGNPDHASLFGDMGTWAKNAASPLMNVNCLIRLALAAAAIGICYMIIFAGAGRFGEDSDQMQKFVGFAMIAMGGVPLAVVLAFVGITANPIIRVAMERENSLADWPEFSMADWFSQFIYVATSFWLAAFPGAILGSLLAATYRSPIPLVFAIVISSLTLAPFFLSSVVFNESPWSVVSPRVLPTLKPLRNRWIRFLLAAFLIGILIPLTTFLAGFGILALVIAGFQVAMLFVYYWLLGDLTGNVVRWMMDQADD